MKKDVSRKGAKKGRISTPQRNSLRIPQGRDYADYAD